MNRDLVDGALPLVARAVVAVILLTFGAPVKFLDYPGQVAFFASLGVPLPAVMVLVSGTIELVGAVAIGLGIAGRYAAVVVTVNMVAAVVLGGPNPFSVAALLGALVVVALGTGPYSLWSPTPPRMVAGGR